MSLSPTSQKMIDRFEAMKADLPGADLPWLAALREKSAAAFREKGLPTQRDEEWKYTGLGALEKLELNEAAQPAQVQPDQLPAAISDGSRLAFVDGRFDASLSQIEQAAGVTVSTVGEMLASDPTSLEKLLAGIDDGLPMLALNGALQEDGYVITLDAGAVADTPIEVLYMDTGNAAKVCQPRNIISAADNARVRLIESHVGLAAASQVFFNGVTLVAADSGSRIEHVRLQSQSAGAVHVNTIRANVAKDAAYQSFVLASGGDVARDEIQVSLDASGAAAKLHGIYLGGRKQVIDNTTVITHRAPYTASEEMYRGALDAESRGVFQGNILVEQGADGTDGQMSNKTLLLSNKAEIDSKPQLEIYADDVKCAHGSTAGELDEDALFYLRSRGVPENAARAMLVEGFLAEVVEDFGADDLNEMLIGRVSDWLTVNGQG